ncbi:hypothetical protein YC2023_022222 [Brassica napus]
MGISKNILIAFVFAILFVLSNIICADIITDFGVKHEYKKCYKACNHDEDKCERFCGAMSFQLIGKCFSDICCCISKNKIK